MRTALASILLVLLGGCGQEFESEDPEPPPPCWQDPWSCPAGQVCWFDTMTTMACLNVGQGTEGTACDSYIGAPRCAEDLFCLQTVEGQPGTCTYYCDPTDVAHACPQNRPCHQAQGGGIVVHVCEPP